MRKDNSVMSGYGAPTARITRSKAAASRLSTGVLPLEPSVMKPDKKRTQRETSVTAAVQPKKRAALKDVTNICCDNSYKGVTNAARIQSKVSTRVKAGPTKTKLCSSTKHSMLVPSISVGNTLVNDDAKSKMAERVQKAVMLEPQAASVPMQLNGSVLAPQNVASARDGESTCDTALFTEHNPRGLAKHFGHTMNAKDNVCEDNGGSKALGFIDIDSDIANPQMCSFYAPDIYINLRAAELIRRPRSNFMETLQRDITQGMRGILIDWLVEVSEEYRLVPDTLYLTVYLIDRFLSENYVERPRLQLLGITCMLIASKYEEICAPRVEEFCCITDNTYKKEEVLKMESQVLNCLEFWLSVPTIKTFLRRFLRAAQASYKAPTLSLGYLANYLAELTMIEYSFLKFLPSVIAASAVFLARWTLDQSDHPWNQTLEHYTAYTASDLKATVLALQELQLNLRNCPLNAIREKYRHEKYESVAALTSPQLLQSLFSRDPCFRLSTS